MKALYRSKSGIEEVMNRSDRGDIEGVWKAQEIGKKATNNLSEFSGKIAIISRLQSIIAWHLLYIWHEDTASIKHKARRKCVETQTRRRIPRVKPAYLVISLHDHPLAALAAFLTLIARHYWWGYKSPPRVITQSQLSTPQWKE